MGFAVGNAQHIGARPEQQDAFGFSDSSDRMFVDHGGLLGIVADGVGGLSHGSEASQSAVRAFLQAYHLKSPRESIPAALARSLREANEAVLRVASKPSAEGAGTTLAAAVLHDHSLYWISAGDSRVYLLHAGKLTRVTADHTYARQLDEQVAQGKISRAEAQNNSERGSLTSYLGQPEPKEVDRNTRPLALQPDDSVIVCSDGFYRALNDLEIVEAFRNDLQRACEALVSQALAKQRNGQDNLTVIAIAQSRRIRQLWPAELEGSRVRLQVLASAVLILALLSLAGYWYEKDFSKARQAEQPPPGPSAKQGENAADKKADTKPKETSPPTNTTLPAAATPQAAAPPAKSAQAPQLKSQKPPKTQSSLRARSGQHAKGQKPPKGPKAAAPTSGQVSGATPTPPASPAAPVETNPVSPPANTQGQSPPSNPTPGSNQETAPTTTPTSPTPPPANDTKPNGLSNLAFGGTTRAALRFHNEDHLRFLAPSWLPGTKDGESSCHS